MFGMGNSPTLAILNSQVNAGAVDRHEMKHVRLMVPRDVKVARLHEGLRGGRTTRGYIADSIVEGLSAARERRHCRSCGFPLGAGEAILTFRYCWLDDPDYPESEAVTLHAAGCRHGAAHELVTSGRTYRTRLADLDEVEVALFGMHADGASNTRIASAVGTTAASVDRVLRGIAKRLRLSGDRHARAVASDLLANDGPIAPTTSEDEIEALIREVSA